MTRKNFFVLCIASISACISLHAQNFSIRGSVFEEDEATTIPFASVVIRDAKVGTQTDADGKFTLDGVMPGDVVEFSFIGMTTVSIQLAPDHFNEDLKVILKPENTYLDQVVVTGYGTSRKRDLTGAITSISGDDIKDAPSSNVISGLQGKIPGLMVINSGSAGSTPNIKIRGIGTLNASSNPLYVVDGMFMDDISFLPSSDVESIEVLKDPSSLATFGVQGANGVIIITTKKASESRVVVSLDSYVGLQSVFSRDRVQLTNADEFMMLYNEMIHNEDPQNPSWAPEILGEGTDWQKLLIKDAAVITNHNLKIAKSDNKSSTMLSLGYFYQDGAVKYNNYQRLNARLSQEYNVSDNVKVGANLSVAAVKNTPASADIQDAVLAIPNYEPYAPESDWDAENPGSLYHPSADIQSNVPNPVANMEIYKGTRQNDSYRILGDLFAEFRFLKDFTLRASGYADIDLGSKWQYTPKYDVNNARSFSSHKTVKTEFSRESSKNFVYQGDLTLNYKKSINDHRITAMVGATARHTSNLGFNGKVDSLANGMNVVPDPLRMLSMGGNINKSTSDWFSEYSFVSFIARATYAYKDRYLLTATLRGDGSSKFAPSHRWGVFPSVGLGWVISDEPFFTVPKSTINFAKLRVSWGMLGNDKIGNYLYYPTINPKGKQIMMNGETVYIPTMSYDIDEDIHWEVMSGFDVGLNMQMFRQRLNFELGWYNKVTRDLLAYVSVSSSLGSSYAITNAGSIRNGGFELSLSWSDKIGDFSYGADLNGATVNNRVLSLGDNNSDIISGDYHRTSVGHPVGSYFGYVQDGIFQNQAEIDNYCEMSWKAKPGDIKYADLDTDGKITDKDRDFIGNPIPKLTYGFGLNFGWKGLELRADFNGVAGNQIIDLKKCVAWTNVNYYSKHLARWHGENTSDTEPALDKSRGQNFLCSTNLLESGSYIRLRNIQLSYTIPQRLTMKAKLSQVKFYLNGQNMITWRHTSGYTPEIGGGILDGGQDDGSTYPIPSVYTLGVSLTF